MATIIDEKDLVISDKHMYPGFTTDFEDYQHIRKKRDGVKTSKSKLAAEIGS